MFVAQCLVRKSLPREGEHVQRASVTSNSETIQCRTVIDAVDLAVINGEPAEVIPCLHRGAALVKQLACPGIQSHQHSRMSSRTAFFGCQQILFPFLLT